MIPPPLQLGFLKPAGNQMHAGCLVGTGMPRSALSGEDRQAEKALKVHWE